jgi:protein-arginine kinase activator protein McsA
MDSKEQVRQRVSSIARSVNELRSQLSVAVHKEEYELATRLRHEALKLQLELILLVNKKKENRQ